MMPPPVAAASPAPAARPGAVRLQKKGVQLFLKAADPLQPDSDPGALGRREAKALLAESVDDAPPQKGVYFIPVIHMQDIKIFLYPQIRSDFRR
jgi:hypothetical protein